MNELENENQEIENPSAENTSAEIPIEDDNEPSVVDKIYSGEVDFRTLDGATRKTVKEAAKNRYDEIQKQASELGWSDKPFFLGKDRNGNDVPWKSAEEYLKTFNLPQVKKERANHFAEENRKLKEELDKLTKMTKMNLDRNLQNDEVAIETRIKNAKENLDVDELEKALEEKRKFQANKNEVKQYYENPAQEKQLTEQEIIAQMPEDLKEAYFDFKGKNLWFGLKNEPELNQFAQQEWNSIQYATNMNEKQKFDYVSARVRQAFPSKFPKQTTNYMPTTNTVTNKPIIKTDQKTSESVYEKLPQRDKEKISNLIASGKFSNREAVMKNFGLI